MRNKILVVFMVIALWTAGQVPNTTTFSLQDVLNVVNPPMQAAVPTDRYDLQDCFAAAASSYFNATYKAQYYSAAGNLNNLLMFRDYGAHNASTPISIVGSTNTDYTTATTSLQQIVPSGTNVGDLLIIYTGIDENYLLTVPSGWLSIYGYSGGSPHNSFILHSKIATASDLSATFTVNSATAARGTIGIIAFRNMKSSSPYYNVSPYLSSTNSGTFNLNNSGSGTSNSMNIVVTNLELNSTGTMSATSGWDNLGGVNLGNRYYINIYSKVQSSALWDDFSITSSVAGYGVGGRIQILPAN
jgi:hypothetical protein